MNELSVSDKKRANMSLVKSKNTKVELLVFRYLRKNRIYFKKHYSRVPGKPDIALPRKKKAVFIDGDFWHGRTFHKLQSTRTPDDYWVLKIARNIERDKAQRNELNLLGWKILIIWESDINRLSSRSMSLSKISDFLLYDS